MPQGLAPVTARRARRLVRRAAKPLLCVVLALATLVSPWESGLLPGPLENLVGQPDAAAQTSTVINGTPDNCPTSPGLWSPQPGDSDHQSAPECILELPVCPEHPLTDLYPALAGTHLAPSSDFPDFCEITVLESADPAMYASCTGLGGSAIKNTGTAPNRECRIIQPARCAAQLHRIRFDACLRVQRRTWSCPANTVPRNQFNTCYQPPPGYTGPSPACGTGAPDFPVVTCEEYVGGDFVRIPPTPGACNTTYPTGDPSTALQDHAANQYWCRYDASFLNVDCHATGAACATAYAYCIRRASRTGGCDTVAETLRCRSLQADYLDSTLTVSAEDVYRQGCTPCVVLPFETVSTECPDELRHSPSRTSGAREQARFQWAHTFKVDFLEGDLYCVRTAHNSGMTPTCNTRRCADPARGRVVWDSSHHSGVAVVNSPITLSIEDLPDQTRTVDFIALRFGWLWTLEPDSTLVYEYSSSTPGDPSVRTHMNINPSRTYTTVDYAMVRGECRVETWPDFRVLVEELWPDNDATVIQNLFGASALNWWTALSQSERQQHTEARGLNYVVGMTPTDLGLELERRAQSLNKEIRCNQGDDVWCRWTPSRSGYYRLTAVGGWMLAQHAGRIWRWPAQVTRIESFLQNHVASGDGDCTSGTQNFRDYDCIKQWLLDRNLQPADVGIEDDLVLQEFTGLLPRLPHQDYEWLYSAAAGEHYACPPLDVRASCGSLAGAVNYTESEPIGILVHEVQVHTVTATR